MARRIRVEHALLPLLLAACAGQPAVRPDEPVPAAFAQERIRRPDLPAPVHRVLQARMGRHAETVNGLVGAVLYLDYPQIEAGAATIAEEPRYAGWADAAPEKPSAHLPRAFFGYQEELIGHARTLRAAAEARDAQRVSDAFADVMRTCVRCHATYIEDR